MKIGVFSTRIDPEEGGGFTFESSIMTKLVSDPPREHTFTFLAPRGNLLDKASATGCQTIVFPPPGRLRLLAEVQALLHRRAGQAAKLSRGIDLLIKKANLDVLWCLGPWTPTTEIPFVITVWDLQHRLQPWFPEVGANGEWRRREEHYAEVLRRASRIVVGNSVGASEVERFYQIANDRIVLAPHPVPLWAEEKIQTRGKQQPRSSRGEPPQLLYPAQFWPHKNHFHLLSALRILADEGIETRCILVGANKLNREYIDDLIFGLDLADLVTIKGFVPLHELDGLYRDSDALVYPSLFGPENLPPLEAFATGLPVAAADVPGARAQLGDAAVLFDPLDPADIAAKVKSVLTEAQLRQSLVNNGYQIAEHRSLTRFIATVLDSVESFQPTRQTWN